MTHKNKVRTAYLWQTRAIITIFACVSLASFLSLISSDSSPNSSGIALATCSGNADAVDSSSSGIAYNTSSNTAVLGPNDGDFARVYDLSDRLVLDLTDILKSGANYTIRWRRRTSYSNVENADIVIEESSDKINWVEQPIQPATSQQTFTNTTLTANTDTRYLRIRQATASNDDFDVDAITYSNADCCGGLPVVGSSSGLVGTCDGNAAKNDARIAISDIQQADRAAISSPNATSYDGADYNGAATIIDNRITFEDLTHQTRYIIRLFDGASGCPLDVELSTPLPPDACPSLPIDLPWAGSTCNGQSILMQSGITALTCAVTEEIQPPSNRWTFGLVDMNSAIPASGRVDNTSQQAMYHHPDWTIDKIGNVFGIAINERTGNIYLAASANYGSGYGVQLEQTSILRYGSIGGGANNLAAAGTVYRLDATTGAPSVFAVLPQQTSTFTSHDCENSTSLNRTTGVGLGNIVYDESNNQYFVSNIEDGRIYRLGTDGTILDSFDPFTEDDGAAGISILEELPYGLAVEPNGNRLFFGVVDAPQAGSRNAGVGNPGVYSIGLTFDGGFSGTVDNSNNPSGATYDNYVGTEVLHTTIDVGANEANNTFTDNTVYLIADMEFTPDNKLLVGVRVSCQNSFFGSYNHWGEVNLLTANAFGMYSNNQGDYDISVNGDAADDDVYGGVASYALQDGSGDIHYLVTSSDVLTEAGPHGVAIFDQNASTTARVEPLGVVSYGTVDNGDPKGVGGDVEVYSACIPKGIVTIESVTQTCNSNNTPADDTDDYIVFNFRARNTSAGLLDRYEVVYNDTVLATAIYGNNVSVAFSNTEQTERFAADGSSVYYFQLRDVNDFECFARYNSTPESDCSLCPAQVCLPVGIDIQRSE